ncbi:MAG: prephenate/arogenate dehydrogenase family protein [Alphaproteobacteria bacterium]|nr:prephenate/arogenate dehydrogenase family protein [Alphaproteobacteria bacterium]
MPNQSLFNKVALVGIGLIGSSLALGLRKHGMAGTITIGDANPDHVERARARGLGDHVTGSNAEAVRDADLVVLGVPVSAMGAVAADIAQALKPGAIVVDTGSTKQSVIRDVAPHLPKGVHFVPAHPIAGTENSGPDAGFAELFEGRYCILTPPPGTDKAAVEKVTEMWARCGATVEAMEAVHHDKVFAITSHLPHLIAYTIVGTATDLADDIKTEVIRYSASGFRDFTRIAASDPTMWRDVFLNNREAVLEMIQRFSEDLTALQRAIRHGEGDKLFNLFTRTRAIRRGIVDAKQHVPEDQKLKPGK